MLCLLALPADDYEGLDAGLRLLEDYSSLLSADFSNLIGGLFVLPSYLTFLNDFSALSEEVSRTTEALGAIESLMKMEDKAALDAGLRSLGEYSDLLGVSLKGTLNDLSKTRTYSEIGGDLVIMEDAVFNRGQLNQVDFDLSKERDLNVVVAELDAMDLQLGKLTYTYILAQEDNFVQVDSLALAVGNEMVDRGLIKGGLSSRSALSDPLIRLDWDYIDASKVRITFGNVQATGKRLWADRKIKKPMMIFPKRRKTNSEPITCSVKLSGRSSSWSKLPCRTCNPKFPGSNPLKIKSIVPNEISASP